MPTGYTRIIEDDKDVTFRDYALRCARAFGACMSMRDNALGPAPERIKVSDYAVNAVTRDQKALDELNAMTEKERLEYGRKLVAEEAARRERDDKEEAEVNERYGRIRQDVLRWSPAGELEGLKKFMLEQIEMCYRPDDPIRNYRKAQKTDPMDAYRQAVKDAAQKLAWSVEALEKEQERVASSNKWLALLYASLPPDTLPAPPLPDANGGRE